MRGRRGGSRDRAGHRRRNPQPRSDPRRRPSGSGAPRRRMPWRGPDTACCASDASYGHYRTAIHDRRTRCRFCALENCAATMPSSSSMTASTESHVALSEVLHERFGHREFRRGQEPIVEAVIGGLDVLAVMPTGSGKSLCYQLPAIVLPGTTIVVSPLISLMKDQVDELNRRAISSAALHSMLTTAQRRTVEQALHEGRQRLLYVAPERFASDAFLQVLAQIAVSRFVVDEAHCVSEWGHDFRPDYRRLRAAAQRCRRADGREGRPPIAAFTATATPEVREDIAAMLGLEAPRVARVGLRSSQHLPARAAHARRARE